MTKDRQAILPHQRGFTLVEIMVTLVIIAIAAALVSPAILSMAPDISLKSAARDVYANLQKAKISAIKENKDFAVIFDTANNRYAICSDWGADGKWNTLADNTVIANPGIIDLNNEYDYGMVFGHGDVPADNAIVPPGAFPLDNVSYSYTDPTTLVVHDNVVVFNSRGLGNSGSVYLNHIKNTTAYAINSNLSGVIQLKKWTGASWE